MRQPICAERSREILCRNRRTALKRVYVPLLNGSERHLALERRFVDRLHRVAALASACFIIRLEPASQKASSPEGLASATALSTALLAFLAFWQTGSFDAPVPPPPEVLVAALYLGLIPSALCGYLQTIAQKTVPPSSAAVVYATDPLWAAFFAYFALNERLGPAGLSGAALIAAAAFGQNLLLRDCDVEDSCDVE